MKGICYQCANGKHDKCYGKGSYHECICKCRDKKS